MPLSLEEVAADFTRWVEALDPASPTCARDAWQAFMTHVQRPLHWLGPRAPDELDDVWDVTSGQPRDDRVVVQLQRRIVRYSAGGDYDGEAIAACVLRLAPEGWAGVERVAEQQPAATAASVAEINAARRRFEATAGCAAFVGSPVRSIALSISGFPSDLGVDVRP